MTTGERIKNARINAGLGQSEFAELIGETKQSVYKYENGIVENIPLKKIERMASVLGVTEAYLCGWEEHKEHDTTELDEYLEMLKSRPECRMLLKVSKNATKAEVEENVRFIEALRKARTDVD